MDVYRKEIAATKNMVDYAFYMTFFPHLVAGPIVRAKDFLPQIYNYTIIDSAVFKESFFRIITGLVKKLFIADYLAKYADLVYASPGVFSGGENLLSMYAYTFQIYFDFSGYSDIALGLALLLKPSRKGLFKVVKPSFAGSNDAFFHLLTNSFCLPACLSFTR